ncbi:MAG: hypothetical protein M3297_00615 [Thermoproteota archaeon]|nr:hypothetical protein [Thermoproteota archaeon]
MEDSVVAKSTGEQEEDDMESQDAALFRYLRTKKKISKEEANYIEQNQQQQYEKKLNNDNYQACEKCKFNLPDERMCHVVEGNVDNKHGISKYFSPKGEGMLPGDIVWEFVKKVGNKLTYEEGHVIDNGAQGYQCKDCKYYLYYGNCLLISGYTMNNDSESRFTPEMSCGFIVKIGQGTKI